jgi:hypothetical protein
MNLTERMDRYTAAAKAHDRATAAWVRAAEAEGLAHAEMERTRKVRDAAEAALHTNGDGHGEADG